jgi:hypothetical protein
MNSPKDLNLRMEMSPIAARTQAGVIARVSKAGLFKRRSPHFAAIAVNGGITAWR